MRIVWFGSLKTVPGLVGCIAMLGTGLLLAGCGHSDPGVPTLSVTCDGSLMLAGAASVSANSTDTGTRLSFPDPANPGQTGTLPIAAGRSCVITPVLSEGKADGQHPAPAH